MKESRQRLQAVRGQPVVVGFGSARRNDDEGLWQPHQRHTLSAILSVPSWWRIVDLKIRTCWLTEDDVVLDARTGIKECGKNGKSGEDYDDRIKLPGDHKEFSRKLEVEVIDEPNITSSDPVKLRIGHPGAVLI